MILFEIKMDLQKKKEKILIFPFTAIVESTKKSLYLKMSEIHLTWRRRSNQNHLLH